MFKLCHKKVFAFWLILWVSSVNADDIDVFSGTVVQSSTAAELVFAIDTSTTMLCGLNQDLDAGKDACLANFYLTEQARSELGYTKANDVKVETIQNVMRQVLNPGSEIFPGEVRVGLAFYNDPGGAIVQPIRALSDTVNLGDIETQRELLLAEIDAMVPQGGTPILGTLLEVGQYLQSQAVIAGTRRIDSLNITEDYDWDRDLYDQMLPADWRFLDDRRYTHKQSKRISHPDSTQSNTRSHQIDADCVTAIASDPIHGYFDASCESEALQPISEGHILYNEDINSASVCTEADDGGISQAATQIVLITDGLPTFEKMSLPVNGARVGTWVKRFVSGDPNAQGFLNPGEGVDQVSAGLSENDRFNDLGCPITANANAPAVVAFDESDWQAQLNSAVKQRYVNIYPGPDGETRTITRDLNGDNIVDVTTDGVLPPEQLIIPSFDMQQRQYESCMYNMALRFRELGVKVHVVGFGLGVGADNSILERIAGISGGTFMQTDNAEDLQQFIASVAEVGIDAAQVTAAASPSISVNPGAILANSDDVYFPMFTPSTTSFPYGNLKKFRLDSGTNQDGVAYTRILDSNEQEALETCDYLDDQGSSLGSYLCFSADSQSIWSDEVDGSIVTKGGAAAKQAVYGPHPDGGRRVYIQNSATNGLELLGLLASNPQENTSGPDANAKNVTDPDSNVSTATRDYFAQLIENPDTPGEMFADYSELSSHDQFDTLVNAPSVYGMLRWLVGFDAQRFNQDGIFEPGLVGDPSANSEREQLADNAPQANGDDLQRSRLYYGSIIHSVPSVLNYAVNKTNDEYRYDNAVVVSGNDGFLRILDADTGEEFSSFFPASLIKNIPPMYKNRPGRITYGLDSSWTVWRQDLPDDEGFFDGSINGGSGFQSDNHGFLRIYGGMRRGGRHYYFLDVTDREQPQLLKEIQGGDVTDTSDAFARLGQTWSQPVLARVRLPGDSLPTVVLLFGGGYDPDYDFDEVGQASGPCADTSEDNTVLCGNQIYMVKAGGYTDRDDTSGIGDVIWWASDYGNASNDHAVVANMTHSIPAQVKTLDKDADGLVDRIYVGDLGGQIFRISIDNDADSMSDFIDITTIAQLGIEGVEGAGDSDNRAFFEQPSVAVMRDCNYNRSIGVALGSGWRERPLDREVNDEVYFIRDAYDDGDENGAPLQRPSGDYGSADFILNFSNIASAPQDIQNAFLQNSYQALAVALDNEGEKAFGSPAILMGNVFLPSYIPPSQAELASSESECLPPPQRSRVTWFQAQCGVPSFQLNNDGTITRTELADGELPAVYQTETERSVAFTGLGVHLGNDSVSILAGTKAISVSLGDDKIKKTQWRQLGSGREVAPWYEGDEDSTEDE